jgi:SsrA-binding protein
MAARSGTDKDRQVVATHRRARYEYEILETVEAGLVLLGPEVKSLRAGRANLADAYASIRRGEAWLHHAHISPYEQAGRENPDPRRERKLLLHRSEIARLEGKVAEKGLTLVPLEIYFKQGRAKVRLGLARGKRHYDKRQAIRTREQARELQRVSRRGRQGA